jgi:hypothetical protein
MGWADFDGSPGADLSASGVGESRSERTEGAQRGRPGRAQKELEPHGMASGDGVKTCNPSRWTSETITCG